MTPKYIVSALLLCAACSPQQQPIHDEPSPHVFVAPAAESWSRLRPAYWTADDGSKFNAPWWWWSNPAAPDLPDYAQNVYGVLRDRTIAVPHAWRPLYDNKMASLCLFYETTDGRVRCLPGWVQQRVEDAVDGYYGEPTCADWRRWLYVLPADETAKSPSQHYLVTTGTETGSKPTVSDAHAYTGRVYRRYLSGPVRLCDEYRGDTLKFFTRGEDHQLSEFVALGGATVGDVP